LTEHTLYICDMCGAEQELNTSPQRMETNYVRFIGMVANLSKDLSVQALCPNCAVDVGEFITKNRRLISHRTKKTENRVSTIR
jgi:hypothetical protein